MIKNFKIFENIENREKYESLVKLCKNKFYFGRIPGEINVIFVTNVEIDNSTIYHPLHYLKIKLHVYIAQFKKNDTINFNYYVWNYSEDEINKIHFMTPIEFFDNYQDLCIDLYSEISNKKLKPFIIEEFKKVLDTIPDIQSFVAAKKYNL